MSKVIDLNVFKANRNDAKVEPAPTVVANNDEYTQRIERIRASLQRIQVLMKEINSDNKPKQ